MTTPLNNLTDTWNNGATVFYGLKYNITNTASASTSKPFDFQIGGQSFFRSNTDGSVFVDQQFGGLTGIPFTVSYQGTNALTVGYQGVITATGAAASFIFTNTSSTINKISWGALTEIYSPTAGILEFRQLTVAGGLRVYNTTDSGINNYERGVFDWTTTSNVLTIDVQVLGTGTQRVISIKHLDSATGGGTATFAATNCPASTLTSPYTWIKVTSSDGSIVYMPAWK